VNEAIFTTTLDGSIATWNPAAQHIFGYEPHEIIGKPLSRLVAAENQQRHSEILKRLRRGEATKDYETHWISRDSGIVEITLTRTPIFADINHPAACLIVCNDVSERTRLDLAERDQLFLSSIVSSADDAIVSKDLNGIVTSWNRAAEVVFGYSAEEMIGKSVSMLIPENQPDEEQQILKRIRRGERVEHFEPSDDARMATSSTYPSPSRRFGTASAASLVLPKSLVTLRSRSVCRRRNWPNPFSAPSSNPPKTQS
jgi:PAS domain S-box-containing protein